jgi:nucleoside-diphosphate-sugar epimerase
MRVLIIGATGFIGRHLVQSALVAGFDVHAIARRADHCLPCDTHVATAPFDVEEYSAVVRKNGINVVVNLLAAGVEPSDRDEQHLLEANAFFPPRLVLATAAAGAVAFVQVGSSAEYATPIADDPLVETDPLETARLYGATKAAGSLLVQSVARNVGMAATVIRPFNIFGVGEKPHRLFPSVARRLASAEPVNLSSGTQIRDFLDVEDACDAILRVTKGLADASVEPGIYNLGSGDPLSVRDFVARLARILGASPDLLRFGALPQRPDDLPYVVASIAKLEAAIGPIRHRSLEESMIRAVSELNAKSKAATDG